MTEYKSQDLTVAYEGRTIIIKLDVNDALELDNALCILSKVKIRQDDGDYVCDEEIEIPRIVDRLRWELNHPMKRAAAVNIASASPECVQAMNDYSEMRLKEAEAKREAEAGNKLNSIVKEWNAHFKDLRFIYRYATRNATHGVTGFTYLQDAAAQLIPNPGIPISVGKVLGMRLYATGEAIAIEALAKYFHRHGINLKTQDMPAIEWAERSPPPVIDMIPQNGPDALAMEGES